MKVLIIAPLPPPITGNSLAARILVDELADNEQPEVVNLTKGSFRGGVDSLERIGQVARIFKEVSRKTKNMDVIYLTIAESVAGNIRDIFIYTICYRSLAKMIIHLLGGAGIRNILLDKRHPLHAFNKYFISRIGAVIVEGETQVRIFSNMIEREKIHIVPNFAEDYLFLDEHEISAKFERPKPLRILFLTNLIQGKGHNELLDAFLALDNKTQKCVTIDFAGGFESEFQKAEFLKLTQGIDQIKYHGIVGSAEKRKLLSRAHVLCLPTYYPFEGQPFCILEGYAAGCVVITTYHSGIPDVFEDGINGFRVQKQSAESIRSVIEKMVYSGESLLTIAISNRNVADAKFRKSRYSASMLKIIEDIGLDRK